MKHVLCIVGPTASGKTRIAVEIASLYPSALISADSRQVYKGMDIVTGKDHPEGVKLWGIDLVSPDEDCSVAVWHRAVSPALELPALPIVVGGTGLYVRALTEGIATMDIRPDPALRRELDGVAISELQNRLRTVDPRKLDSMNESDRQNPRRLIRAIEVAQGQGIRLSNLSVGRRDTLIIGLKKFDDSNQRTNIETRVHQRIQAGAIGETAKLLERYSASQPSLSAIGYRSIIKYLERKCTEAEMVASWVNDEVAYAKRQLTWFHKVPGIVWLDSGDPHLSVQIAKLVQNWYD